LWIFSILFLYFSVNRENVITCIEVYSFLPRYGGTMLLLVIPSILVSLIAAVRLIKSYASRRG
jgi:hypothetical protein